MKRPGTYILEIVLSFNVELDVGALGTLRFLAGSYCYVGSALGGLDQRVSRHISRDKRVYWHINRLTIAADSVEVYSSYPDFISEYTLKSMAAEFGITLFAEGFGCSDCECRMHLFWADPKEIARLVAEAELISFYIISFPSGKPL